MKKFLLILSLFILSVNSFADEYDDYESATEKKVTTSKQAAPLQLGIGFNILTGTNFEWRVNFNLDQDITLFFLSNFIRCEDDENAYYNFSLGIGVAFNFSTKILPSYAGASVKYIHPSTNNNGAVINVFGGIKAVFLDAFEVAGELGIYFEQQDISIFGLRPAIYLSWYIF